MGKTNDAHYIGERAAHAANIINERRGWVQSMQRRDENIDKIFNDCMAILKAMPKFDRNSCSNMLAAKGYQLQTKSDAQNRVCGYSIRMGNSIYKSSIIGAGRKLMPSKIEATWAKLHYHEVQTSTTLTDKSDDVNRQNTPIVNDNPSQDMRQKQEVSSAIHFSIPVNDRIFDIDIPNAVMSVFDEEFKELNTSDDVLATDFMKVAALLFAEYLDGATSMTASSGGGGGPSSSWGKDKDEDERNWARRCARMAHWMCKPMKRSYKR
jgi:hypothetical protein